MGNPTNTGLHTNIRHRSKRYHAGDSFAVQLKMAVDIGLQLLGQPQFFKITGKTLGGKKGTTVRVVKTQKSKAEESLQVVVLKPRRLSLSIRPVQEIGRAHV